MIASAAETLSRAPSNPPMLQTLHRAKRRNLLVDESGARPERYNVGQGLRSRI